MHLEHILHTVQLMDVDAVISSNWGTSCTPLLMKGKNKMTCSNCENIHKVTGMTYTAGTSLVLATTNSTNINSLDNYCFILPCNQNPKTVVTGAPVGVYMTINGGNYPLYNKFHLQVMSNYLYRRKLYKAWFVNNGTTAWVELAELPVCKAHA